MRRRPDDADARWQAAAERMLLQVLQGYCNSPVAGYASTETDGRLSPRAPHRPRTTPSMAWSATSPSTWSCCFGDHRISRRAADATARKPMLA